MADMDKLVSRFVQDEIALSGRDISSAAKSREWFLTRLQNTIQETLDAGEEIPQLYAECPFVKFGSYFKGTKVRDVDEYDILVVLDSNGGQFYQQAGVVVGKGKGTCSPCHKYEKKYFKEDGSGVSPAKLLNWLKSIVEEIVTAFDGEAPERAGQAITATIKSKDLKIDLVPAGVFTSISDNSRTFYDIPRGDKDNGWILTAPHEDMELVREMAADRPDFKNIIRIIKSVRQDYNFVMSSFAVECSVIRFAGAYNWHTSIATNLCGTLADFASRLEQKSILDTWDDTTNLIADLESYAWYAERVRGICTLLDQLRWERDDEKAYQKLRAKLRNAA